MSRPIYRRGKPYAKSVRQLLRLSAHPEFDATLNQYQLALVQAVRQDLAPRELQCLTCYYLQQLSMEAAARKLDVNISTISRNIRRGEDKLDRLMILAREISPIRFDQSA